MTLAAFARCGPLAMAAGVAEGAGYRATDLPDGISSSGKGAEKVAVLN